MNNLKLLLILFCTQIVFAQRAEQPDQTYNLGASINEMTLSFVPKVVIVILTIAIFTNYLLILELLQEQQYFFQQQQSLLHF